MSFKSRLLTTAFVLPVTGWLALSAANAFDLTGTSTDEAYTSSVATSANPDDAESITIDGTPSNGDAALLIDSDTNVTIDGAIVIRDRDGTGDDATLSDLDNGIAIKLDSALTGTNSIRLKDGAQIGVVEILGPSVDENGDGYYDNDADRDFIIEGSAAFAGTNRRIGLWVNQTVNAALIGENGSLITLEGNAATIGDVTGIKIDGALADRLDISTDINMFGDKVRGVHINATIGDTYRQRGDIDVRGEEGVGIDIDAAISGALLIEGLVNATGYSTIPSNTIGGPTRGGEDTLDTNEFDETRRAANPQERRRSDSALDIGADIAMGVIINGQQNAIVTKAENDSRSAISEARTDDDDTNDDVTALKTDPYHYDENRAAGRVTSYGENDDAAALKITATLGTAAGATRETFLDTTDDDDDDTTASSDDTADVYDLDDSMQAFYYSHGLMNRGRIEANTLYDAVKSGSYSIENKATAVLIDDGTDNETIHGGIYNSGLISAEAHNSNAIAVDIRSIELTDGQRTGDHAGSIFLNEGSVTAQITTNEKSYEGIDADDRTATAVKIGGDVTFNVTGTPEFTNAGTVAVLSRHTQDTGQTDDNDNIIYEDVVGQRAIAFDFSGITDDFNLTQRLRVEDRLVDTGAANSASNPFQGGGDMDIDASGDLDGDGNNTADGKFDTRDNIVLPLITGDVHFGGGDNQLLMTAGALVGTIKFGAGDDSLILGNSMGDDANDADDEDDDYTAPITSFRGRITNTSGTLDITAGGQTAINGETTLLHFDGQEGVDLNGDGDDADAGEESAGVEINDLNLSENAQLRFTVNPNLLDEDEAVLDVTTFSMGDDVTLSLDISNLVPQDRALVLIEADNDLSSYAGGINNRAPEDAAYPYIYDVDLAIDESGDNDRLLANFSLKSADDMGLNAAEGEALNTVIAHFKGNPQLERAITSLTEQDAFLGAYGELFPHYGDGTMKQLASLAQSANGAVSQHLQIVNAGGRRDGDGWLQQFGDYRKQDAGTLASTLSGTSLGLAMGFDAPAGFLDAVGGYVQMSFTSVNEKSSSINEVKAESFVFGAYLSDAIGPLQYELSAATGSVSFDSRRAATFNTVSDQIIAGWDGTSTSASARLAYPILDMRHLLRLEAGMDYFSLDQDGYSETSLFADDPELSFTLGDGESELTSQFIGLRGGLRTGGGSPSEIVWEPNYYIGFRTTGDYKPYTAAANFAGHDGDGFTLQGSDVMEDQSEVGFGIAAHNDYFAFEFNYRGQFSDDTQVHGGGLTVRLLF